MNVTQDQIAEELARCTALQQMQETPGWIIIKTHFDTICQVLNEKILAEENMALLPRLQERYRAFSSMLHMVKDYTSLSEYYKKLLEELETESAA